MSKITSIVAFEVLDSRGNPTVKVEVGLENGIVARAIVPSGASTGTHEALELRDKDEKRYLGKGVLKAVKNVNTTIANEICGMEAQHQQKIDRKMIDLDGTMNKENLGANAILGVSLAVARVAAKDNYMPLFQYIGHVAGIENPHLLPTPMMNVINGGEHADSGLEIQEFMIMPVGAETFSEALRMGSEIFHHLKKILKSRGMVIAVGDEGGFAPHLEKNEDAIEVILEAVEAAGHAGKIQIALDAAASEFYEDGKGYKIGGSYKTSEQMQEYYVALTQKYPIISIEDAFFEDDWDAFTGLTEKIGDTVQLVGDDLCVTNPRRVQMCLARKCVNSLLVKPNQIGTLSETIETVHMARKTGKWTAVMSHRSGETEDTTIADLAVGLETGQIKTGSLCRSERIAKYNQLLRIEAELDGKAKYQGAIR